MMLNNFKKGLIIFSLFFILILSLGAISASDDFDNQMGDADSDLSVNENINLANENNDEDIVSNIENDVNEKDNDDNILSEEIPSTITVNGGTFGDIQNAINESNDGDIIELNGTFVSTGDSISFSQNLTIKGTEGTVLDANGYKCIFSLNGVDQNVLFDGLKFINVKQPSGNVPEYGAIRNVYGSSGNYTFSNCIFENNSLCFDWWGEVPNCLVYDSIFTNNHLGSNVNLLSNCNLTNNMIIHSNLIEGCDFLNDTWITADSVNNSIFRNSSCSGSTIIYTEYLTNCILENNSAEGNNNEDYNEVYYSVASAKYVSNCSFANNNLKTFGHALDCENGNVQNCTFINNRNKGSGAAIFSYESIISNCSFINNHAANGAAIEGSGSVISNCSFINNHAIGDKSYGGAIWVWASNITNCTFINNSAARGGAIDLNDPTNIKNCVFINNSASQFGSAIAAWADLNLINSKFVNNIAKGGKNNLGWHLTNYANSTIVCVDWGETHKFKAVNCTGLFKNSDAFKEKTTLTSASITKIFNVGKYLVVTLVGDFNENPLKGLKVSIKFNGKTFTKTTNSKGQVKLLIGSVVPKNYTATISFAGNNFCKKSSKSVKVVVKKATPKFTASNKAFKRAVKTKKYIATLKNNKGAVIKNAKLTIKVNGKTFTAKTNSKGKATFKITNLKRKGTFKAVIKFAGSKYYNKISKTVKITAK